MPNTHIFFILVEDKFLIFLIDGVIGKMHADIIHVIFVGGYIGLSSKSS